MKKEVFTYNNVEYLIYIGKDKSENWALIDAAVPSDIWFHVKDVPSCHVILKCSGKLKDVPRAVLSRCFILCKQNSPKSSEKSEIIYAPINNVKKGCHEGQVVVTSAKVL
jgi:predicted ribosome quality control (RQC) complex YloA/Tae2 family protein